MLKCCLLASLSFNFKEEIFSEIKYYIIEQSLLYCLKKLLERWSEKVGDITYFDLEFNLITS